MNSLFRALSFAYPLAGAAVSPYSGCRLYCAVATKRQAPTSRLGTKTTVSGRARAASNPSRKTEVLDDSSAASPIKTSYGMSRPSMEPLREPDGATWPKPAEIPFQAKVANSVSLIGRVHMPVQFQAASDDKGFSARTEITLDRPSVLPYFRIPIVFEGDLAHIAASHLKEKDLIYVEGQLYPCSPEFHQSLGHTNIQVLAQSLNIIEVSSQVKLANTLQKHEKPATTKQDGKKKYEDSWRDLLRSPEEWMDNRRAKEEGSVSNKFPDFKRKDNTAAVWLISAPEWALSGIEGIRFGGSDQPKPANGNNVVGDDFWSDLVENPSKWWDNRSSKIRPTYPDFKHKESRQALWLNRAPSWVLPKLPPLK
ncbi:hypothetical protein SAY87_009593 [Trapa incisa]|uniref:Uncharacterized protein n=1 Tax=Trapa incisa TaxID=236973 RepID=A0AAN7PXV5_9MYRT|nr:hypothetical protein SAY87_009593 [Trapa incisa]